MATLPILNLGSDPYERGLTHGRALTRQISENIDTYLARFGAGGLNAETARAEGVKWIDVMGRQNADYAEEMRGISDGAKIILGDIAMLNARYEITFGLFGDEAQANDATGLTGEADGCSTFGVLPEASANGHTLLGQNWDWLAGVHGRCVVRRQNGRQRARHRACRKRPGLRSRRPKRL